MYAQQERHETRRLVEAQHACLTLPCDVHRSKVGERKCSSRQSDEGTLVYAPCSSSAIYLLHAEVNLQPTFHHMHTLQACSVYGHEMKDRSTAVKQPSAYLSRALSASRCARACSSSALRKSDTYFSPLGKCVMYYRQGSQG